MTWTPPDIKGKVAWVAGATRGSGRGIARALGEAGATVYCTGRTTRQQRSSMDRPETIEETAEMVDAAGGTGVAVQVDHLDAPAVRACAARIQEEHGGLDLLVNDIWGGDPHVAWGKPFWEQDPDDAWRILETAWRTHMITAHAAFPGLQARKGLLVEVTDGDTLHYRGNVLYDSVKAGIIRYAYALDQDLKTEGAAAVCVTPGFLRSEAMLEHMKVTEETWADGAKEDPHFIASESPLFVGRGVAHLAADPDREWMRGRVWASWTLSDRYGFPDADGSQPHWGHHVAREFPAPLMPQDDALLERWRPWP